jgi:hypothetical protein
MPARLISSPVNLTSSPAAQPVRFSNLQPFVLHKPLQDSNLSRSSDPQPSVYGCAGLFPM